MDASVSKELLTKLVEYYESALKASQESRALAERDRDYYDHNQWTEAQIAALRSRNQSATIVNHIALNVNTLKGQEAKNRTDPKAYPRTPIHEEAAYAASDAIRFVCDNNNFDSKASDVFENLLIEGCGGAVVEVEKKGEELDISIVRIPWDRTFADPHSREKDYSDARFKGYISWMDMEDAEALAEKSGYQGGFTVEGSSIHGESHEDKPSYQVWHDSSRKRVKVCYIWHYEKGEWNYSIFTKAGIIYGGEPCPYLDKDGESECNFILQSSMVDRENNRYGYVRGLIDQQDAINKRESKAIHLLSQRQTWAKDGAFIDPTKAKTELAKPDGHIEVNKTAEMGKDFGVLSTGDMAQGQFALLQEAKNNITLVASSGNTSDQPTQSGRALEARAQSSAFVTSPYTEAYRQWKIRVYRCIWTKVRQYWKEEKWLRVTDDEDNLKWVGLNAPLLMAEQMVMEHTGEKIQDVRKNYKDVIEKAISENPAYGQPVKIDNQVAELDVDIVLDEDVDTINIQSEQFQTIANIAERRGDIPTPLIIEMSSLRNKDQILEKMQGSEQDKNQAAQAAQVQQDLFNRKEQAEILDTEASAEKTLQEAIQTQVETQLMLNAPIENQTAR